VNVHSTVEDVRGGGPISNISLTDVDAETLLPILLTSLGTLLAVGAGARLQRGSEHQKWLRETRLRASGRR
jgi:hypothetical protein